MQQVDLRLVRRLWLGSSFLTCSCRAYTQKFFNLGFPVNKHEVELQNLSITPSYISSLISLFALIDLSIFLYNLWVLLIEMHIYLCFVFVQVGKLSFPPRMKSLSSTQILVWQSGYDDHMDVPFVLLYSSLVNHSLHSHIDIAGTGKTLIRRTAIHPATRWSKSEYSSCVNTVQLWAWSDPA